MSQTITLANHQFTLIHRSNRRIKRVGIVLENKDEIIVKTPLGFKPNSIKEIVYSYQDWILKNLSKVGAKNRFDLYRGGLIPFLGKKYPIEFIEDSSISFVKVSFKDDRFIILCNDINSSYELFYEGLKIFYKNNAKKIIDPIFKELSLKTDLYPTKISYRFTRKQWGSCSYKNNISINYMLLQHDLEAIRYVVLHELCHIKEKNHSKRFYTLLSSYMPHYKEAEKMLRL